MISNFHSAANAFLRKFGYALLEELSRARFGKDAPNIVAYDSVRDSLVFVSVEYCKGNPPPRPKRRDGEEYNKACSKWLLANKWTHDIRHDTIIIYDDGAVDHIESTKIKERKWK